MDSNFSYLIVKILLLGSQKDLINEQNNIELGILSFKYKMRFLNILILRLINLKNASFINFKNYKNCLVYYFQIHSFNDVTVNI